jgi:voltage-gated potassium channel
MAKARNQRGQNASPHTSRGDKTDVRRPSRRHVLGSLLRVCIVTTTLFVLYALAPLGRPEGTTAAQLAWSIIIFIVVISWQILAVTRSPHPRLRAVEAVAVSLPFFLLLFAATYFVMGRADPASFTEPLTRIDAFYFTVTVFATVGFGDITPYTEVARVVVIVQMLADLLLIGLIAKVLLGIVQRRGQALEPPGTHPVDADRDVVAPHTDT